MQASICLSFDQNYWNNSKILEKISIYKNHSRAAEKVWLAVCGLWAALWPFLLYSNF
jgi:hypothetical protein